MTTEAVAPPPSTKSQVLRSFDVTDFPALGGQEEEWRFTPLKRLKGLASLVVADVPAESAHWPGRSDGKLPEGVSVHSVGRDDSRVGSVLTPFDRVSALAYNAFDRATVIEVAKEARPEPTVLEVIGGPDDLPAFAHTVIDAGAFSESTLIVQHTGGGVLADNIEVIVRDGAKLTLVTLAEWDGRAVQAQHIKFQVGRDARVVHVQVALGGDLVRQYTSVEYLGRGGEAELYGLYFADAGQHLEHRQLVDHTAPDCRSYVGYRGALQGRSAHTVWVGDVLIRATATGTDTYEINRNLILTDGARADSIPNLEIETGEVAGAGHASATGRFDDEQLFYLMSRGITEGEARKLVVRGFFAELVNKIPLPELRERLGDAIEARLVEAGA